MVWLLLVPKPSWKNVESGTSEIWDAGTEPVAKLADPGLPFTTPNDSWNPCTLSLFENTLIWKKFPGSCRLDQLSAVNVTSKSSVKSAGLAATVLKMSYCALPTPSFTTTSRPNPEPVSISRAMVPSVAPVVDCW